MLISTKIQLKQTTNVLSQRWLRVTSRLPPVALPRLPPKGYMRLFASDNPLGTQATKTSPMVQDEEKDVSGYTKRLRTGATAGNGRGREKSATTGKRDPRGNNLGVERKRCQREKKTQKARKAASQLDNNQGSHETPKHKRNRNKRAADSPGGGHARRSSAPD